MRVLFVKLTSMGDVLHLLPALSDLHKHHPDVKVDWMVEDSFSELPAWHPIVNRVIPVATRRWRKLSLSSVREFFAFVKALRSQPYDMVVDAQGLIKSAVFARIAKCTKKGVRAGFSGASIKESPAAYLYQKRVHVSREQHAIMRLRKLCAGVFNYQVLDDQPINYSIQSIKPEGNEQKEAPTILLLHGTTWSTKHLPKQRWRELADLITQDGYRVILCWGNEAEHQRAKWVAENRDSVHVLPKSSLSDLAATIANVTGVLAVDTGLGHMAAALGVPAVSIYGPTDALLTGSIGDKQTHLQSTYACSPCLLKECNKLTPYITDPPCYEEFNAPRIWQTLRHSIEQ